MAARCFRSASLSFRSFMIDLVRAPTVVAIDTATFDALTGGAANTGTPTYLMLGGQEDSSPHRARVWRSASWSRSARRPREGAATDDVYVQMKDALSRTRATVHGETEIAPTVCASDLRRDTMQVADERVVLRCQIREGRDVFPWDHQDVRRCRRIDVAKRDRMRILVHAICACLPR